MSTVVNAQQAEAIKNLKNLINETYEAKLEVSKAEEKFKKLQAELNTLMQSSEIDSFEADNCKVFCKVKSSVSLPKNVEQKNKVFEYIKTKYGEEVLGDMLTINPATFNSFYNNEAEIAIKEGNLDFNLADLKPFDYFSLSFRKK